MHPRAPLKAGRIVLALCRRLHNAPQRKRLRWHRAALARYSSRPSEARPCAVAVLQRSGASAANGRESDAATHALNAVEARTVAERRAQAAELADVDKLHAESVARTSKNAKKARARLDAAERELRLAREADGQAKSAARGAVMNREDHRERLRKELHATAHPVLSTYLWQLRELLANELQAALEF